MATVVSDAQWDCIRLLRPPLTEAPLEAPFHVCEQQHGVAALMGLNLTAALHVERWPTCVTSRFGRNRSCMRPYADLTSREGHQTTRAFSLHFCKLPAAGSVSELQGGQPIRPIQLGNICYAPGCTEQ
jgi:hypothetical protein